MNTIFERSMDIGNRTSERWKSYMKAFAEALADILNSSMFTNIGSGWKILNVDDTWDRRGNEVAASTIRAAVELEQDKYDFRIRINFLIVPNSGGELAMLADMWKMHSDSSYTNIGRDSSVGEHGIVNHSGIRMTGSLATAERDAVLAAEKIHLEDEVQKIYKSALKSVERSGYEVNVRN